MNAKTVKCKPKPLEISLGYVYNKNSLNKLYNAR